MCTQDVVTVISTWPLGSTLWHCAYKSTAFLDACVITIVRILYMWSTIIRYMSYEGLSYMQVVSMEILGLLVVEHLQTEVVWRCV